MDDQELQPNEQDQQDHIEPLTEDHVLEIVQEYMQSSAFTDRKLTDDPNDDLMVVNRKYVTNNGALTARPVSSVATVGQRYYDTTNNVPIYYTTAGWRNTSGSIVALNN